MCDHKLMTSGNNKAIIMYACARCGKKWNKVRSKIGPIRPMDCPFCGAEFDRHPITVKQFCDKYGLSIDEYFNDKYSR